jgi:hypothetical protein
MYAHGMIESTRAGDCGTAPRPVLPKEALRF